MEQNIRVLQVDDFFKNPDRVRGCALEQIFNEPNDEDNWRGLRTNLMGGTIDGIDIEKYIIDTARKHLPQLPDFDLDWVFHILPEDDFYKENGIDYDYVCSHKDNEADTIYFAGVVYLSPNPPEKSGTSFFEDINTKLAEVDNEYNRMVFYPSDVLHSPTKPFGLGKEDGRLTLTFFCKIL